LNHHLEKFSSHMVSRIELNFGTQLFERHMNPSASANL
jgi:hypothetical protein